MKKFYTLFISLILLMASVTFIACQTNAEENKDDDKATEYTITINAPNGTVEFDKTKAKAGETVKLTKLEADDGYTFKTMSIKKENGDDVTEVDHQNQTFTMPESNVVVTVNFEKEDTQTDDDEETSSDTYSIFARARDGDGYRLDNTSSESGKEVALPIMTSDGNTPTGLYLVNVSISDKSTGNDIKSTVGLKIEDNKIKFTMPSNNVEVYASFEDVSFEAVYDATSKDSLFVATNETTDNLDFDVGICFTEKVFDNLEYIDSKYVFRVANKGAFNEPEEWSDDWSHGWYYDCKITSTAKNYKSCAIVGEKVFPSIDRQVDIKLDN